MGATTQTQGTLSPEFYRKFYDIKLGLRDDQATDETELQTAIPAIWSKVIEKEFRGRLYWQDLIGTSRYSGVVERTDLTKQPGDQIHINKIADLTALGDLGTTHVLFNNEEKLDVQRALTLTPVRKGNAVAWMRGAANKVNFPMREEAKEVLGAWWAKKLDKMCMDAALSNPGNTIYAGTAGSKALLQETDTLSTLELKRAMTILREADSPPLDNPNINGDYIVIVHPRQAFDLLNDPVFIQASVEKAKESEVWTGRLTSWMGADIRQTTRAHTQTTEASPGIDAFAAIMIGARALGLGWLKLLKWAELQHGYGEILGVACDAWLDVGVLNPESICVIYSGATRVAT